ncbi:carbohydrate ABC transporter permease [Schaalia naturae]|uniref:Carbohydrate ABC transporter permease n=1 Tax=Schaalia naturae TaxID=635203 RepID=A0ABW2SNL9_9ACTO
MSRIAVRRAGEAPSRSWRRVSGGQALRYLVLVLGFAAIVGPLLWQVSLAFKGAGDDLYARPPYLIPHDPTFENFTEAFSRVPILRYVANSVIVAAIDIAGNVVGASCAGYALARLRFRGRGLVTGVFVVGLLVPVEAVIVSQFLIVRDLGLANTLFAVALPGLVTPINVLLMRNAFLGIPKELEEAAIIDGANAWQRFARVCLPQVKGVVAVTAIFAFMGAWNDFLWPLIVASDESIYTLTLGLNRLRGTFYSDPRLIAAGTIIALVPIIVVFALAQKQFFRGLEAGGIKG